MGNDYVTQNYEVGRCGWNPRETILDVATVSKGLQLLFTQPVDGQVYAQPLYVQNLQMGDGTTHDVVFAATEADSVYAFDADTAADPLWHVTLLNDGESPVQGKADLDGCDNTDPQVGITATPVIDVAANTLYVVTRSKSGSEFHTRLHALDPMSGAEQPNSPVDIQVDDFDPRLHNNRAGLLLAGGRLYIAFGAHCDRDPYRGRVLAYDPVQLTQLAAFNCAPNSGTDDTGFAGIWQSGIGLSADEDGNVFFTTGNGMFTADSGGQDYGNSVLKLGPDLTVLDYFTPRNQARLMEKDWDLGSGGVIVLPEQAGGPHPRLAVVCGKQGIIYVLDRAGDMGKYNGPEGDDNVVDSVVLYPDRVSTLPGAPLGTDANTPGVYGAPAYYAGPGGPRVYVCGSNGPIKAFVLQNEKLTPHTLDSGDSNQSQDSYMGQVDETGKASAAGGCTPVVSSNADQPGTGVVWAVTRHGPLMLRAYDAEDLRTPIFEGLAGMWNNAHGCPFSVPTVAEGKVYVGTGNGLSVFGPALSTWAFESGAG